VHGDVKPDNIQLKDDGTSILLDLGFAHRPGENVSFLKAGCVLGTVEYMAPELCGFRDEGNASSDVFSLGATLYEMLSGHLPFPDGSLKQTLRRHQCDPPAALHTTRTDCPRELEGIVSEMLAHQPDARPSMRMLIRRLVSLEITSLRKTA
jgi:serine/threonine protein kinase